MREQPGDEVVVAEACIDGCRRGTAVNHEIGSMIIVSSAGCYP